MTNILHRYSKFIAVLFLGVFTISLQAAMHESQSRYMHDFDKKLLEVQPPWNAPIYPATEVTVPGLENVPDIHGDINNPQLVIFFAGNQYMLVNKLMKSFMKSYPKYKRVVAFTLPPGRLITSIRRGNGILLGNMRIMLKPDILTAGHGSIMALEHKYHWFEKNEVYAKNKLAIMVYKGNPKKIVNFDSLADPKLRLCMPNPEWEGIAKHAIIPALKKAGGESLVQKIYVQKVKEGSTYLTHIHHRQTPINIMEHKCDAGVVWYTEAYFHDKIAHHPISIVKIADKDNKVVGYTAALMKSAPHKAAAKDFMKFLMSKKGQEIYKNYGFMKP
jgi:molybdate transport system substrate-binding protein